MAKLNMEADAISELSTMPTYGLNSFALWVAKATEAYFQNPDVKRRFEEWQKERENNLQSSDNPSEDITDENTGG